MNIITKLQDGRARADNCYAARWLLLSIYLARIVPAEAILLGAFYSSPSFISLLCCPLVLKTSPPEVAQFLKFRNRESLFLLPVHEMRNWNRKMIPFLFLL